MNAKEVGALVGEAVKKHTDPRLGTRLLVLASDIRVRDGWWCVPVYPEHEVKNLYDMYDSLANAMEELEELEGGGLKIQIVPALSPEPVA